MTRTEHAQSLLLLEEADARLSRGARWLRSLAPGRARPTPLAELGRAHLRSSTPPAVLALLSDGMRRLVDAMLEHFPDNLFWDFDFLFATLARAAHAEPLDAVARRLALIVGLHEVFGRHTEIHFRYVHDFLYGFDWAKWVRRDPEPRAVEHPLGEAFLAAMRHRADELIALIAQNDATYPRIEQGLARNPFAFSREPDDELALFGDLAVRGLVPVEAWNADGAFTWDRPYADLRCDRALALGLARPSSAVRTS
jgi:hypothetical protein